MSQISKCPKVTVVLTYLEASGEVSELRYKSLLYFSSKRSYCIGEVYLSEIGKESVHSILANPVHPPCPSVRGLISILHLIR